MGNLVEGLYKTFPYRIQLQPNKLNASLMKRELCVALSMATFSAAQWISPNKASILLWGKENRLQVLVASALTFVFWAIFDIFVANRLADSKALSVVCDAPGHASLSDTLFYLQRVLNRKDLYETLLAEIKTSSYQLPLTIAQLALEQKPMKVPYDRLFQILESGLSKLSTSNPLPPNEVSTLEKLVPLLFLLVEKRFAFSEDYQKKLKDIIKTIVDSDPTIFFQFVEIAANSPGVVKLLPTLQKAKWVSSDSSADPIPKISLDRVEAVVQKLITSNLNNWIYFKLFVPKVTDKHPISKEIIRLAIQGQNWELLKHFAKNLKLLALTKSPYEELLEIYLTEITNLGPLSSSSKELASLIKESLIDHIPNFNASLIEKIAAVGKKDHGVSLCVELLTYLQEKNKFSLLSPEETLKIGKSISSPRVLSAIKKSLLSDDKNRQKVLKYYIQSLNEPQGSFIEGMKLKVDFACELIDCIVEAKDRDLFSSGEQKTIKERLKHHKPGGTFRSATSTTPQQTRWENLSKLFPAES